MNNVHSFGQNGDGQLVLGDTNGRFEPVKTSLTDIRSISAGGYHSGFITIEGKLFTIGYNRFDQLGFDSGSSLNCLELYMVDVPEVAQLSCAFNHTIVLTIDGEVFAFGANNDGELGVGDTETKCTPTKVEIPNPVRLISTGVYHSMFVDIEGKLYTTGYNSYGQLGIDSTKKAINPTHVDISGEVRVISKGGYHTIAKTSDDIIYGFGNNTDNQLGFFNQSPVLSPTPLPNEYYSTIRHTRNFHKHKSARK